ncbi:IPP [Branchiostoma lanceolatum]|uniref:IPP protein n=1 Tax=Branchiostoma lanceolatum TaxID=7740 RepID=A0A8J9VHL7_BRALA|nr:IPP [Branchiostoma lanceolatum]
MLTTMAAAGGGRGVTGEETLHFHADWHSKNVLSQFNKLRGRREFCDVEFSVGTSLFPVHRAVVAACSPYFAAMLGGGMSEAHRGQVELHAVEPDVFNMLLDFMYTGSIDVTVGNVQDLLAAADMFQLPDVISACTSFLRCQLHPSNAIGIYMYAEAHACQDLCSASLAYIQSHFSQVTREEEFFNVSKELLSELLSSEDLHVENEYQVFTSAMSWIMYDVTKRRRFVYDILSPVRFPLISPQCLSKYLKHVLTDLSLQIVLQKLFEDYNIICKPGRPMLRPLKNFGFTKPRRNARKFLYVAGGYTRLPGERWSDSHTINMAECYDSFSQRWSFLPPLNYCRSGHGIAVLHGKVYAVGGESDSLIYDNVECFDPAVNRWTILPSVMTVPRCGLGVCVLQDSIYAIGGWVGSEIGNTIERYDPEVKKWEVVGRVETLRFCMGVTEMDGFLYVVGGMSDLGSELRSAEFYDPVTQDWTRLPDMKERRAYVGVGTLGGCLYAVGGWNDQKEALRTVEKYSPVEDKWREVAPLSTARAGASVAAINNMLYVLGGRSSTRGYAAPVTLNTVECYDPDTDTWLQLGTMATSRCEAAAAVT